MQFRPRPILDLPGVSCFVLQIFLDKLDTRVSALAAVDLAVGKPEKSDIKESLLAEAILAKLLANYQPIKEILYQKRPLTLKII